MTARCRTCGRFVGACRECGAGIASAASRGSMSTADPSWLRWSGLRTQQPGLDGRCRVMPDRHRRGHAQEAELAVEAFGPRVGVQDDLLVVAEQRHEPPDNRRPEPASLTRPAQRRTRRDLKPRSRSTASSRIGRAPAQAESRQWRPGRWFAASTGTLARRRPPGQSRHTESTAGIGLCRSAALRPVMEQVRKNARRTALCVVDPR